MDYHTIKDDCSYTMSRASAKEAIRLYGEEATNRSLVEEIDGLMSQKIVGKAVSIIKDLKTALKD